MKRRIGFLSMVAIAFLSFACGGPKHMVKSAANIAPMPEAATIVFYRPSSYGGSITSAIFDVTNPETQFLGSVKKKGKIVARVPAGAHTFMILGENADFSYATLEAGKVYYMTVQVRMGVMKARFSLIPVQKDKLAEEVPKADSCTLYEKSPASDVWFNDHRSDIEKKRAAYYEKWMTKPESERPHLLATDC